ncbi:hypothetical protein NECAME_05051 [Necator americanus]|uniref:Uncharacterized protein n=1 Tax=Necator americanus TaxID=51031 RepID=W2SKA8_NECAM|nr:hypothetical protein NECAME_05051 [Necator americanus]ETN69993.1 hypothetical protein NECAME_05051 [Necator americanus]
MSPAVVTEIETSEVSFSRTSERGVQTQLHTGVEKSLHYAEPPGDGLAPVKRYERLARGPGLS